MRIGVDMLGIQSEASRGRGIGRYSRSFLSALLKASTCDQFVLYSHAGLPEDGFLASANATVQRLSADAGPAEAIQAISSRNPDGLDALLILSPFELHEAYNPPPKPLNGLVVAAVVYDLLAFLFQERYLTYRPAAERFYGNFFRLRQYDALLAISEATASDLTRLLGRTKSSVRAIGTASDPSFFTPGPESEDDEVLRRFALDRPFVFCVASLDERKNLAGLIDAFSLLPEAVREAHLLVVSCALHEKDRARAMTRAAERGIDRQLVLTGETTDNELRALYRRCAVFAFPSLYEGFGLPILEAMLCGAPVLAGANSSQVEVVQEAGLLANAHDSTDIAAKLVQILTDPDLARSLRERGFLQARTFDWTDVGNRALDALHAACEDRSTSRRRLGRSARKPRVAVFSPWPPRDSGISDYSCRLVRELGKSCHLDLYHDSGYTPVLDADLESVRVHDQRLYRRHAALRGHDACLYQMGNSYHHHFLYKHLLDHGGIVTLHDFSLAGYHEWASRQPELPGDYFERELEYSHSHQVGPTEDLRRELIEEGGLLADACARRGLWLNRRVLERAERVIVHSPWHLSRIESLSPVHLAKTDLVPMGATVRRLAKAQITAIRKRHALDDQTLVLGSFGIIHPSKMNIETVLAFENIAAGFPDAVLIFVGSELDWGATRALVEARGLTGRVRFLGRQPDADYQDLIAATDIGITLRRPPTNGETSASLLDLLRHGIPTIVSDVGTFSDYPDHVVRKVRSQRASVGDLPGAIRSLAEDASRRERLGSSAFEYVAAQHTWRRAGELYLEVIERAMKLRMTSAGTSSSWSRAG